MHIIYEKIHTGDVCSFLSIGIELGPKLSSRTIYWVKHYLDKARCLYAENKKKIPA